MGKIRCALSATTAISALILGTPTIGYAATGAHGLEEIVVTAEKRSSNLQRTAVTENVLSAKQLIENGISTPNDLQKEVPNLLVQQSGPLMNYYIRGVGAGVTGPDDQPGVAFNVDGVYTESPYLSQAVMFDVAQVEVLKGPQGTLFGRNATAGAINVTTQNPKFDLGGYFDLEAGNFGTVKASGALDLPVNNKVAIRLAFNSANHGGYDRDRTDDENIKAGRFKLLYQPDATVKFLLSTDYEWLGGKGGATIPFGANGAPLSSNPWAGVADPAVQNAESPAHASAPIFGFPSGYYGKGAEQNINNYGVTGQLDWKQPFVTAELLAGYHVADAQAVSYDTGFGLPVDNISREKSVELRLASPTDASRISWTAGLYYYGQVITGEQAALLGSAGTPLAADPGAGFVASEVIDGFNNYNIHNTTNNYAAFTQATVPITNRIRLVAGGRVLNEEQTHGDTRVNYFLGAAAPPFASSSAAHWNTATWSAGVEADVTPNSFAYARAATGWKAGGTTDAEAPYSSFKPEELRSYTLGVKNRFFGNSVHLNGELFYWDYSHSQYSTFVVANVNGVPTPSPIPVNAAKAHIEGADIDASWLATVNDRFTLALEYILQARYDQFILPSLSPVAGCAVVGGSVYDCSGSNLPNEPHISATAGYVHSFLLPDSSLVQFDASTKYQTHVLTTLNAGGSGFQKAYTLSGMGLTYIPPSTRWTVRVYVNNIENAVVKTAGALSPVTGTAWGAILPPRTYGVQFHYDF